MRNLTTAAGLWLGSSIGMLIGFDYYGIALMVTIVARFIPDGRGYLIREHILDDIHEKHNNKQIEKHDEKPTAPIA